MKFAELLVALTFVSGLIWVLDILFLKSRRKAIRETQEKGRSDFGLISVNDKPPIWVEYARSFFPVFLLVLILRSFLAEPFRIPSGSMKPTLVEGDFILVNKFKYGLRLPVLGTKFYALGTPKRGEVIVFKNETLKKDLIKRVVGLPGDHILYKEKILYINGQPAKQEFQGFDRYVGENGMLWPVMLNRESLNGMEHSIYLSKVAPMNFDYPYNDLVVPENSYFVMGDNRDRSDDSRFWGLVRDEDIMGQAVATWMSWDGLNHDIRWERIFKAIQ